jgi:peptidoglycan/LPS O-acetylase OafA/YrhL
LETRRLLSIDILRGLAAIGVFVFHAATLAGFPKYTLPPFRLFGREFSDVPSVLTFGATGVSLFFVISGFCLALKPFEKGRTSVPLKPYARSRCSRIYPAYFVAILVSVLLLQAQSLPWSAATAVAFLVFLQGFIQPIYFSINSPMWSMASEVQFYVLFPLFYAILSRTRIAWTLAACLVLCVAYRYGVTRLPNAEHVAGGITFSGLLTNLIPGRAFEFVAGMTMAAAYSRDAARLRRWCLLLMFPVSLIGLGLRARGPNWSADPAMGAAYAVIIGIAVTTPSASGWIGHQFAKFGRASYSYFLLHMPLTQLVANCVDLPRLSPYARLLVLCVLAFAVTLPAAVLLYKLVEMPVWHRYCGGRPIQAAP